MVVLDILETIEVDDRLEAGESGIDSWPKYIDEILGGVSREFDDGSARADGRVIEGSSDALDQRRRRVAQLSGKKLAGDGLRALGGFGSQRDLGKWGSLSTARGEE